MKRRLFDTCAQRRFVMTMPDAQATGSLGIFVSQT
jgi:hypothetical protein